MTNSFLSLVVLEFWGAFFDSLATGCFFEDCLDAVFAVVFELLIVLVSGWVLFDLYVTLTWLRVTVLLVVTAVGLALLFEAGKSFDLEETWVFYLVSFLPCLALAGRLLDLGS